MPVWFTIVCIFALAALLVATARESTIGRYTSKPIASAAFILVALTGGALGRDGSPYGAWITAGLVLGAAGDIALMLPGKRAFSVGLVAFLCGHVAYVFAFHQLLPIGQWFGLTSLLPGFVAAGVIAWLWPHLGSMRVPVLAYVVVISTMVVGALAVVGADALAPANAARALLAGAVLFFLSDLAVARQRFVRESLANRLYGLPAYYAGQLLLAWSAVIAVAP